MGGEPDYILMEKAFNHGKQSANKMQMAKRAATAKSVESSVAGAGSAAGASADASVDPADALQAKKLARLQELQQTY